MSPICHITVTTLININRRNSMKKLMKSFHKMMKSGRLNKVVRMVCNEKNKTHKTPSRESVV